MVETKVPHCYTLTNLTLRSNQQRRVVIHGFDVRRRTFIIFLAALLPGLILTGIFWVFVGSYAVIMFAVAQGAAFWFVEGRSNSGLRLRTYQTLLDKRRSTVGSFSMCGRPFDPTSVPKRTLTQSSVPVTDNSEPQDRLDALYR